MTGTPLDLTPLGGLLNWLFWLLALGLLALAIKKPATRARKIGWTAVVLATFGLGPLLALIGGFVFDSKARKAQSLFEAHCKTAGEHIHRTVENVEGVVWLKWRPKESNHEDQFRMDDPYGQDCQGEGCIASLLRLEGVGDRFQREVGLRKGRYRYVESIDPADGKRYRYTGTMKPSAWSPEGIEKYRREHGTDIPDDSYRFALNREPIDAFSARYGITWDDLSTRGDRENWIAGSSLKIIDLQTNEVIAERIGYMRDQGLGSTAGFRSPWLYADRTACPAFELSTARNPVKASRTRDFIHKVLRSTSGD